MSAFWGGREKHLPKASLGDRHEGEVFRLLPLFPLLLQTGWLLAQAHYSYSAAMT